MNKYFIECVRKGVVYAELIGAPIAVIIVVVLTPHMPLGWRIFNVVVFTLCYVFALLSLKDLK